MGESGASLHDRHAVITGAGRGIGAAIARALSAQGARLTLMGRQAGPLQAVADGLARPAGASHHFVTVDVSDAAAVARAFAEARSRGGHVTILVNNAGQAESAPFARTTLELWQRMLAVNLTGSFLCAQEVLAGMVQEGWGRIVNVASTAGLKGYAYASAYTASKHGVVGLTRSLALETAGKGVTVNAVCPGYAETDLLRESIAKVAARTGRGESATRASFTAANPQGRLVQPEEVADAVVWLCSSGAAAITGQSLSISGGEVM